MNDTGKMIKGSGSVDQISTTLNMATELAKDVIKLVEMIGGFEAVKSDEKSPSIPMTEPYGVMPLLQEKSRSASVEMNEAFNAIGRLRSSL